MKFCFRSFSLIALSLVLMGGIAWAQATAQLNGRVSDTSGAVLPGVTVTATQTDTGFTRIVVTDETGAWVMPNLPIGPYRLEVSLSGFQTNVRTGVVLQVGGTPVINAVLSLGMSRRRSRLQGPRRWWTCEAPASGTWSNRRGSWSSRFKAAR